MVSNQENMDSLIDSLNELRFGYKETKELLDDQLQAVIYNDILKLNRLTDRQVAEYEKLKDKEKIFEKRLTSLFQTYYPDASHPSLTRLIEAIEDPTEEIDQLRVDLYEQVKKTEQVRQQLMSLLEFASDFNQKAVSGFSSLAAGEEHGGYGQTGQLDKSKKQSLRINHKV